MMQWLTDLIWAACRALGWACQLAGLTGLLLAAILGVKGFARWLEP